MRPTTGTAARNDMGARSFSDATAGSVLVLAHVVVVAVSLAGPALILVDTFVENGRLSLAAWLSVFSDWPRWAALLSNTAVVCASAVGSCCLAGVVLAIILFKTDARFRHPTIALLLLCAAVPLYAVNGSVLSIVGIEHARDSPIAVGLIHAVAHLPIAALIVGVGLRSIPREPEEIALVEGVGRVHTLLCVTLRMGVGWLVAALILVTLWVTTDYSVSDVLLVRTFAEEVYTQYALQGRSKEPALVCVPQIVLFGGLLWALRRGYLTGENTPLTTGMKCTFSTGRWRLPFSFAAGLVALVLAVTPLVSLGLQLRGVNDIVGIAATFRAEIGVSFVTSVAAGLLASGLGVGLAWHVVRKRKGRTLVIAYVILMLAIPGPILGMGLIQLFNRPGLAGHIYDSPAMLVVAYLVRFLPIAVILLVPAVRAIPIECELAARVDGCGLFGVWLHIIWPQCIPTALAAMFIVMVLSIGELPCSLLVTPPGYTTVGARFFSLAHYGLYPDAATLCLLSIGSVLVPWLGLLLLWTKRFFDS